MSETKQFLETVKVVDGVFIHSEYNLQRMKQTMNEVFHTSVPDSFFEELIIPENMRWGVVKCRILYSESIDEVQFQPYACRKVASLKLVDGGNIDYSRKYADRTALLNLVQQKGECDDILIVKNGQITDTSYSNVVLSYGTGYYTPKNCLLNGTCRQRLIAEGKIIPRDISVNDLSSFQYLYLINAMIDLDDKVIVPVSNIMR
ncbi:aminotransferase class IV [uncultured Bacteroides sp.]|uniref:aminotransferase class IV n=1 Tax=uncultured Bacteroides sp. TaxID=162156 RepID=UPI002AAC407A|nr:aminotransferase class IV [uncultured Bacteroides sp.]